MTDIKQIRIVRSNGAVYLRAEDVATLIEDMGSGEETDVRNRLKEGARNILKASGVALWTLGLEKEGAST